MAFEQWNPSRTTRLENNCTVHILTFLCDLLGFDFWPLKVKKQMLVCQHDTPTKSHQRSHTLTRLFLGTEHLSCPKTYSFPFVELIFTDHDRSKVPRRGHVYPGAIAGNRDKNNSHIYGGRSFVSSVRLL